MILVWLLDLKFLIEFAAIGVGTSNPPHQRAACTGDTTRRGDCVLDMV
jgi:hypothetical protein